MAGNSTKLYIVTKDGELTKRQTTNGLSLIVCLEFLKEMQPDHCWSYIEREVNENGN